MDFAENIAIESGYSSFRLDTYSHNPKAMEFYKRLGYQQLGHINLKPTKTFTIALKRCFNKGFFILRT